jgi:RimJ/RimL family protein N-acetyltransferase
MKLIFGLIISFFTFSEFCIAIHFNDGVTENELLSFEGNGLSFSLLTEEEGECLFQLCFENIHNHYMDSLFGQRVTWDVELIEDYINTNLEDNQSALNVLRGQSGSIDSLTYSIRLKDEEALIGTLIIGYESKGELFLGIFIGQAYSKNGYATKAIQSAVLWIQKKIQAQKLKWECWEENEASKKVAIKCGFKFLKTRPQENGITLVIYKKALEANELIALMH